MQLVKLSHDCYSSPLCMINQTTFRSCFDFQVLEEMRKAEPRHGERWQRVSKDPANAHPSSETILKKVIIDMDKEAAP